LTTAKCEATPVRGNGRSLGNNSQLDRQSRRLEANDGHVSCLVLLFVHFIFLVAKRSDNYLLLQMLLLPAL
jgi:hypothetical protein